MRLTGLSGVLDSESIIQSLMLLERRPVLRLEQRKAGYETERALWREVDSLLSGLESSLAKLRDGSIFNSKTASSQHANVATAAAGSGAAAGTYEIIVDQLATAHRIASDQQATSQALGLVGNVGINGKQISITGDMTLLDIRDAVNEAKAGVRALVIDNTLIIEAEQTGTDHTIELEDDAGVWRQLGLLTDEPEPHIKHELRAAQDAQFQFEGLKISRSSNVVTDLVQGLTITLTGNSAVVDGLKQPTTIKVEMNINEIRSAIRGFVEAYNAVYGRLNGLLKKGSNFQGNPALIRLQNGLRQAAAAVTGSGSYHSLNSIGITAKGGVDVDPLERGLLELDDAVLNNALRDNVAAVQQLFVTSATDSGTANNVGSRLQNMLDVYLDGGNVIQNQLDGVARQVERLQQDIQRMEARIQRKEEQLYWQFAQLEQALATMMNQQSWLTSITSQLSGRR